MICCFVFDVFYVIQRLIRYLGRTVVRNYVLNIYFQDKIKVPPICARSVFYLRDNEWKRVRSIMSPTFSGGKLKRVKIVLLLFPFYPS